MGRTVERALLEDVVVRHRLVTVTGPGGAGKTRLALAAVAPLAPLSVVELADARDADDLRSFVAAVATHQPSADEAKLFDLLPQSLTLVLDNCEHLVTSAAGFVRSLLGARPDVRVLATSREPLGIAGERVLRLGPLDLDAAVELFRDRAALVAESAIPEEQVRQVCARLDCLPLAVELAAAHTRVLDISEIDARLSDQLAFLRSAWRDVEPRQATIEATIKWSYDLLPPESQLLFRRLAVFGGSFTVEAVEAVCGGEPLGASSSYETLTALVDASLVHRLSGSAPARYRLLEPIRQYAVQLLHRVADDVAPRRATFRREGSRWVVGLSEPMRLPDAKGMGYIGRLLRKPWTDISATELAGAEVVDQADPEVLDERARRAYRRRLEDLDAELEAARRREDVAREAAVEDEREQLLRELSRAVGLGGRVRTTGSTTERARTSVTKAIRGSIERLGAADGELGRHLAQSIKTGVYCRYEPQEPWAWDLDTHP